MPKAKSKPAPKRKRRVFRPAPQFWWMLAIANTLVGVALSPITAAHKVVVLGAEPFDQQRVAQSLAPIKGKRWTDDSGRAAEAKLLELPDVESATVERNLFGRGLVRLSYRQPIARVAETKGIALDAAGIPFPTKQPLDGLPVVRFEGGMVGTNGSLWTTWNARAVADLCTGLSRIEKHGPFEVLVQQTGVLWLNRLSGGQVKLGSHQSLDAKLAALETILGDQPDLLAPGKTLNVSNPAGAVVGTGQGGTP